MPDNRQSPFPARETARLRAALEAADAIVVGAGAGLSASAGLSYGGARFHRHFGDFEAQYGFHDMYTGGFYPFPSPEAHWAYWSRLILLNRYQDGPLPVYEALRCLLAGREFFVLTTNVDHCFQKAGFDKERLFYTQGDYGLFQCSGPCCQRTWDNEDAVRRMAAEQAEGRIPQALLPVCPVCGRPMAMNLRSDDTFVEDAGWHRAAVRYRDFLRRHRTGRVLFWELGVGYNTPAIIKFPFWQMAAANPRAVYACVNSGQAGCPEALRRQAVCIDADIGAVLRELEAPAAPDGEGGVGHGPVA
ncbi:Sir2 silent information regulator family NAD-dependent deacetylase [uncultured Oscillibacter sp.]|uniref:SIR2 family NAD-dependent protein deacylase n=1 Tax=uncultured Oscillibacter sp. TaxID=876091 RepID=UPI0025DDE305|nr:Sir2 silent information regulator family NAD-dependent deacetylase [uncultured Oscillibacter sp.]